MLLTASCRLRGGEKKKREKLDNSKSTLNTKEKKRAMNIVASHGCFPSSSESFSRQLQGSKCKSRRKEELLLLRLRGEERLSVSADPSPFSGAEMQHL